MRFPPEIPNEDARLQRLFDLMVLDTEAEAVLDAFTELASSMTGAPISLISLVDGGRQWWKSAVGLPQGAHTTREISFCGHAIAGDGLFEVEDATRDERFLDNPIVTGEPHVIHYAGMPLVMPGGERIGTICVIDHVPGRLNEASRALLERLAKMVVRVLLLREHDRHLSALVETQTALKASEERFRTILNAMPQMVWTTAPDGSMRFCNERWHEYTGASVASPAVPWIDCVHPEERALVGQAWARSLADGTVYEGHARLRHHSGDYRWVLIRALALRDERGSITQWLGTCTDIEKEKRYEARLQQIDRRKDEFLAMLAHELRNPLAPIATGAQVLLMGKAQPQQVRDTAEMIGRQVRHLTSLVNDLLDVSRVTRGLVSMHTDLVDLKRVVDEAVEQILPLTRDRGQQLEVALADGKFSVRGDAVRLTQVLGNLLNNASKFTPPGGRIGVMVESAGAEACIRVTDTGRGIPAELLPYVFGLFTQEQRTPERSQGGLGLGLALVKSLVELHGGRVTALSEGLNKGSTFTLWLPLANGHAPAGSAAASEVEGGRSLQVTVVDDNPDAARAVAGWLEVLGHRVHVETDPFNALAQASERPAEVYVVDIGMPGMDGYEFARRLRQAEGTAKATLIALTGYGQPQDVAKAREAGFDHHLLKPMDGARMAELLAQVKAKG